MDAALVAARSLPDTSKIDRFDGTHFRRWQEKIYSTLDVLSLAQYLTQPEPQEGSENYEVTIQNWKNGNKVCRHTILSTLSNELFDIYYSYKSSYEIWESLHKKYVIEDVGTQKYAIGNFLKFQMTEDKDISTQINEFHMLLNDLQNEHITLPEAFIAGCLIEKLTDSWKDYKNNMKHKRKQMSLADVVIHIRIEEQNRKRDMSSLSKEFQSKVNIIEGSSSKPRGNLRKYNNKQNNKKN
ncbi:hypothetical protein LguiB_012618 [Lonicera macranthoides]